MPKGNVDKTKESKDEPMNANQALFLSKAEIEVLTENAKKGDDGSALKLAIYYEAIESDETTAIYWYEIGAENDNPICQHNLGMILLLNEDDESKKKAIYWLKKAAKNGNQASKEELEILGIKE